MRMQIRGSHIFRNFSMAGCHMVEVRLTPPSSFTTTTPSTSPNRVCPSSSLVVLDLGLSITLGQLDWGMPRATLLRQLVRTHLNVIPVRFYGMHHPLARAVVQLPDIHVS